MRIIRVSGSSERGVLRSGGNSFHETTAVEKYRIPDLRSWHRAASWSSRHRPRRPSRCGHREPLARGGDLREASVVKGERNPFGGGTYVFQYRYEGSRIVMLRVFHGREAR